MSFKDNLLKKMKIDRLAAQVLSSIKPPGSIQKVDLESMRTLLEMSAYELKVERDLDLYYKNHTADKLKIVVLDNDLPLYRTSIEDVVLRKSPIVKEMTKIRNIIKILSDSDVLTSKREETVRTVQQEGVELLDLSFDESDLDALATDGTTALQDKDPEGVLECISLFAEILDYRRLPKTMGVSELNAVGTKIEIEGGKILWGPLVLYNSASNRLKLVVDQFESGDRGKLDVLHQIAAGTKEADLEGSDVFEFLKKSALRHRR